MSYIVVIGDMADGHYFYGPFSSVDEAVESRVFKQADSYAYVVAVRDPNGEDAS